ncbi:MAG TPA: hypothetical protein VFW16_00365 [Streptosporangiaceae bacterium]|nr:hypothetical protein [Streptosporangiaceae bacterium]
MAADTIEPAGDGLDRIRTKIAAGPPAPVTPAGWAGWSTRYLTALLAALSTAIRFVEPAGIRIRYAYGAVVDRFRPEQGAVGWVAWLRPAAAVATGLLVVVGASWAITALPPTLINTSGNSGPAPAGSSSSRPSSANHGGVNGSSGPISQGGTGVVSASATCTAGSGSATATSSGSPTPSSPSPTGTPTSTSSSPSPSPPSSSSGTGTGSPSDTPTPTGTPNGGQASQSAPADSMSAQQLAHPLPRFSTPKAPRTPQPSSGDASSSCP